MVNREERLPDGTRKVEQTVTWTRLIPPSRNVLIEEIVEEEEGPNNEPQAIPAKDGPQVVPAEDEPHAIPTEGEPQAIAQEDEPKDLPEEDEPLGESFSDLSLSGGQAGWLSEAVPSPDEQPGEAVAGPTSMRDSPPAVEGLILPSPGDSPSRPLSLSPSIWSLGSHHSDDEGPTPWTPTPQLFTRRPNATYRSPPPVRWLPFTYAAKSHEENNFLRQTCKTHKETIANTPKSGHTVPLIGTARPD